MPTPLQTPFYLDWTFWSVVFAAVAILLSQLPPINELLKGPKLGMELYSRAFISHKVGNPNFQVHVILTNTGGRTVRVRAVTLTLRQDGRDLAVLPAQNYRQLPSDTRTVLFTPFSLKTNDEWAHIVNFLKFFDRSDEKQYRAAERALKTDINVKKKMPGNENLLVTADPPLVEPFTRMFDRMFIWHPGEYEAHLAIETLPKDARLEKAYRFTLFESDSTELSEVKADFRYGDGIYFESGKYTGVIVQIVEA